jgi:hypothetical protein
LAKALILFKAQCRWVLIEENEIKIGDKILIIATTGEQELIIEEMLVNEVIVEKAAGDICTFKLPLESVYQIDCISKRLFIIKF